MPFTLDPFLPFIAVGNGTGVEVAGEGRLGGHSCRSLRPHSFR